MFSYERDAAQAAGPNIGLQIFNEPPPEDLYKEAVARTRAGGIIVGGMTSLLDNPWVVDGIFNKADGKHVRVRFGASEENCIEHGKNGNLRHDEIIRSVSQHDPDEREARLSGRPLSFSGRIWKSFDRAFHVAREDILPPERSSVFQVVDPAIGKPMACLWAFVDPAGAVTIYDEHPDIEFHGARDSNLTVKDYTELFKVRENGRQNITRILDRHFGNTRRTLGGLSLRQEFSEAELDFQDSYSIADVASEVETGILKVKEFLRFDTTKPVDSLNRPRLTICPKCKNTIAAMERWSRDAKTGKPREDFKDFADCVRYLCMANPIHEVESSWPKNVARPYYTVT